MSNQLSTGTRVVRFGGSIDMRESCYYLTDSVQLDLTVDPPLLTVRTQHDHDLHDGVEVFLSCQDGSQDEHLSRSLFQHGPVTITGRNTFTMEYDEGLVLESFTETQVAFYVCVPNRAATGSLQRELNALLNGALILQANYATGQTPADILQNRVDSILRLSPQPHLVMGSLGLGDSLLFGASVPQAYCTVTQQIITPLIQAGINVVLILVPGSTDSSPADPRHSVGWFEHLRSMLQEYAEKNHHRFVVYDPTGWSIDDTNGQLFKDFTITTSTSPLEHDKVHPNRLSSRREAIDLADFFRNRIAYPNTDPMVLSYLDAHQHSGGPPYSTNLLSAAYNGGKANVLSGVANVSGSLLVEYDEANIGVKGNKTDCVCSVIPPPALVPPMPSARRGWYQQFVFQPASPTGQTSNDDVFTFRLAGDISAGHGLVDLVKPGETYRAYLDVIWHGVAADGTRTDFPADAIQDFSVTVVADVNYGPDRFGGLDVSGVLAASVSNVTVAASKEKGSLPAGTLLPPATPYDGMHPTESFTIPSTAVSISALDIRITVRMQASREKVALQIGRPTFRKIVRVPPCKGGRR
jgi:hypothetical protein